MNIFLENSNNTNESYFIKIPEQSKNYLDKHYVFFPNIDQSNYWHTFGISDRPLINWIIETFITADKVFLDIGAHVGTYTWLAGKKAKYVHSFECNKKMFCYLAANVVLNNLENNVSLHQYRLGDKNETTGLNIRTLDSFEITNIGFIRIDVNGKEVLMGSLETLKNSNYPTILFKSCNEPKNLRDDLFSYIYSIGYKIINIINYSDMFLAEYINKKYVEYFDKENKTNFIENITNSRKFDGYNYSFNKSLCIKDSIEYYCERIMINNQSGLLRSSCKKEYDVCGLDINAEDPRLILFNGIIYIIFNIKRTDVAYGRKMCISEFEIFNPIELKIRNNYVNTIEKNWSPFVKNNNLYFVYNYDPLVILKYDNDGLCDLEYSQCSFPLDTSVKCLRGGSNLIPYNDNLYITLCHSHTNINNKYYYLGFLVILNTDKFKIEYISKPLMFESKETLYEKLKNTNIIFDERDDLNVFIQYPISINCSSLEENTYIITVNIRDRFSLKYKLNTNIKYETDKDYPINYWDNLVKDYSMNLIKNCSKYQVL